MLDKDYKEAASRAYLHHIIDLGAILAGLFAYKALAMQVTKTNNSTYVDVAQKRIDDYYSQISQAKKAVYKVYGIEGEILYKHVFEHKCYENIGDEIGYELSTVKRKAKAGRIKLYDYLPPEWQ